MNFNPKLEEVRVRPLLQPIVITIASVLTLLAALNLQAHTGDSNTYDASQAKSAGRCHKHSHKRYTYSHWLQHKQRRTNITETKVLELLTQIADEIENYNHTDRAMKWSFRKIVTAKKILNNHSQQDKYPAPVSDGDLLQLLSDIETLLAQNDYPKNRRFFAYSKLSWVYLLLQNQRDGTTNPTPVANLSLDFGSPLYLGLFAVGSSNEFNLTLTNNGTGPASNIVYTGLEAPFFFVNTDCNPTINAGESCQVTLSYDPQTASVLDEDTFEIQYQSGQGLATTSKILQGSAQ